MCRSRRGCRSLSWRTEVWVPRRSFLVVNSENQRSTRLSHERAGRGEMQREAADALSANACTAGCLVGGDVVQDRRGHRRSAGTAASILLQERQELGSTMARVQRADHLAGGHDPTRRTDSRCRGGRSRGWRAPGCRAASGTAARCGRTPGSGSSHRHTSTIARSGGLRYRPTTSRTFSTNSGSLRQLPRILPVRSQSERSPDPRHDRLGQTQMLGHRPRRPVCGSRRAWSPTSW